MGLIELIVVIAVVGVILWLVTNFVPMEPRIKQVLVAVVVIVLVLWVLQAIVGPLPDIRIGR